MSPAIFLAAALLVALVFASVPFVSFWFRSHRSDERAESINYTEFQPPSPPPALPPREIWKNEKLQPLVVPEMEKEPLTLELGLLNDASLSLAMPDATASLSTEALLPDPTDWRVFDQDDLEKAPQPRFTPRPEYPEGLRSKGIVGEVWVHFIIAEDGTVRRAHVGKSTNNGFNAAAIAAVGNWTFDPGMKGRVAVKSRAVVPIEFNLEIQLPE